MSSTRHERLNEEEGRHSGERKLPAEQERQPEAPAKERGDEASAEWKSFYEAVRKHIAAMDE